MIFRVVARRATCLLSSKPHQIQPRATMFWEPDRKSGYRKDDKKPNMLEHIKEGLKMLPAEYKKFNEEMSEKFRCDSLYFKEPGDYETIWKFDNKQTVDSFIVTTDHDNNQGKSTAHFELGKNKTGVFHGVLNTEIPQDGKQKTAGYCNIKSPNNKISFQRDVPYDWSHYTHMLVRCRGDGRGYALICGIDRYFDVAWCDQYNYPLYTRGGPYWQLAKIPFSKFFLSHKGRIQDKQWTLMDQLDKISYLGITVGDGAAGPFQLEIDYIALIYDPSHKEQFGYEMYKVSPSAHS